MTGPDRRRRWGPEARRQILMATFSLGAIVADVSRRLEVSTSLIYKWRREVMDGRAEGQFVPAVIVDEPGDLEPRPGCERAIMVELAIGARVSIGASATVSIVSAAMLALRRFRFRAGLGSGSPRITRICTKACPVSRCSCRSIFSGIRSSATSSFSAARPGR